jgi:PD-(D/E)XK endonuclease
VLTTDLKGAIAEAAIIHAALELDVPVSRPLVDLRYDLIFDLRTKLIKVQCKWASRYRDVIVARCYRARRNADGLLRQFYAPGDVDVFGIYCAELRRCYLVPFADVPPGATLQLRIRPTRNNQVRRIRWAEDYEFAATLRRLGAVAQLGERAAGSRQVTGSSPVGSTSEAASPEAALF